jgi:pimeloyl-ACP methyl ester carboxylesterase/tetratricopeptide (TPR) repeat protein
MKHIILTIILFIPVLTFGQHGHSTKETETKTDLTAGLGDVNHPVSTTNSEAQKFFNQGLAYAYAFNHEEAVRSFRRAAELDPNLAMAHWGASLALGSNYNLQADATQLKQAYEHLQKAIALAPKASEHERDYINALSKRYSADANADRQKLALEYKNAMKQLAEKHPDDMDAATLYAESMMNLRPWQLWSADGKPAEGTLEIVAVLEAVLKRSPNHTGANHYYIHAIEASPNAERGLPSAFRLEKLAPKAGHLVHMPSHIYVRTGDYDRAAQSNADAIVADREYIQKSGANGVYPMMYYNHNIHFLAAANAMKGRYADAIKSAAELEANVAPHLKAMPMLEMFAPYKIVTLVRFGKWDDIAKLEKPGENLKITTAFWHFARGMAHAGTNRIGDAENELKSLQAVAKTVPADAPFGNSGASAVLKVADQMLAGKIALARADKKAAFELLRKAVEAEDATGYNEPSDWDLPAREILGGALLLHDENAEAERVFRAEIAKHPRNGRALFGLVESLRRQNKMSAAQMVERELKEAWQTADTELRVENLAGMPLKDDKTATNQTTQRTGDVRLKTGVRVRYLEQGDPNGTPVIMLHGYGDSSVSYSRVLPLMDAKRRVFVFDQRGHGESDRPASGYKFADFAADVVAFMDAKNLKKAVIVGHSMGSFIAQQVAVTAPERVEKLVLIGSATTVRNNAVLDLQKAVNELKDPVPDKFAREFQYSVVHQPPPDEFMNRVIGESLKVPARVWREVMTGMLAGDAKSQLGKIKAPTLVVWGDKETVFPRTEQDALVAAIPNAVLKVYADTGHCPNWERPEQFVKDFEDFVNR